MYEYPFHVRKLTEDEGGGFLAEAIDLPGCISDGETVDEAAFNLQDAIKCWVLTAQEFGDEVPKPSSSDDYSGKCLLRTPKSLHRKLSDLSKREGVSLNMCMVNILAEGVGKKYASL